MEFVQKTQSSLCSKNIGDKIANLYLVLTPRQCFDKIRIFGIKTITTYILRYSMNYNILLYIFSLLAGNSYVAKALPDGLHKTPPMGWTSWNAFFTYFNEEKMIEQAIALQDLGLDELGYKFLTIDDQWHLPNRDAVTNRMIANPEKFPNGIRFLADFMHERGLKLGIYSSAGRYTCSCNLPGSLEFEEIDVQMMLDFEIDYFKVGKY